MMRTQCRYTPTARSSGAGRTAAVMNAGDRDAQNGTPLAMVYPAEQSFADLYTPAEALNHGTLFKQLDMPFHKGFRL